MPLPEQQPPIEDRHTRTDVPLKNWIINPLIILISALCLYGTSLSLAIHNQFVLGAGLLVTIFAFHTLRAFTKEFGRVLIITLGAFLSLRYWQFRTTETILYHGPWDFLFLMLLYLAETYGIFTHLMGIFVNIAPLEREAPALPEDPARWPGVDIFVPTYNEPVDIVFITLAACTQLDYPREKLNVYVLDDGGTGAKLQDPDRRAALNAKNRAQALKTMAAELGVHYLSRPDNSHAKAGNINAALNLTGGRDDKNGTGPAPGKPSPGELILILDSDHVPTRDFLKNTVGFFLADDKLAFVQTPHFFINPTPVERNLETYKQNPNENEMFYGGVHLGLDFWNASFFCGSAAVLRRSSLMAVGGIESNTITEDAATALKLHSRGYNSLYLNKPMVMGLAPESFDGFVIQRSRWARGMTQILLLKNPLWQKGLSLSQRVCYLNACLYWLFGFARVVFFLSPLMFLFFLLRIYNASLMQVVVYAVPHLMASYAISNILYGRLRHPFFSELFETIQSIYLAPAIMSVFLRPRSPRFRVTPKSVSLENDGPTRLATPFYIMFLLTLLAYPVGIFRWFQNPTLYDTIIICLTWNTFNMLLMLCCLGVVWERKQLRQAHRFVSLEPAQISIGAEAGKIDAVITDLSSGGAGLLVASNVRLSEKDDLTLFVTDSYGHAYRLPLAITRIERSPAGLSIGTSFELTDKATLLSVVGFIYGDSRRWKYFFEKRPQSHVNSVSGFAYLVKIGFKGFLRNFTGILVLTWKRSLTGLTKLYTQKRQAAE
jgi:cellulose synthase (UDP-forming)